jgi:hypothetical protein
LSWGDPKCVRAFLCICPVSKKVVRGFLRDKRKTHLKVDLMNVWDFWNVSLSNESFKFLTVLKFYAINFLNLIEFLTNFNEMPLVTN